jgi:endonuclease-3
MLLSRVGRIKSEDVQKILVILRKKTKGFVPPAIDQIVAEFGHDPFLILISCLLSLRTRDVTSVKVSRDLFSRARTPQEILAIPTGELEKIFHSIGFFRAKARTVKSVCSDLLQRFDGQVPRTEQELRSIKGIGQKTANAVLGFAFNVPAICVDTHVHQLANRLGWVETKTAEQTEKELKKILPQRDWIDLNYLLVTWGQNICTPTRPFCSKCAIAYLCPRVGVTKSR